jgi:aminopeptidase N
MRILRTVLLTLVPAAIVAALVMALTASRPEPAASPPGLNSGRPGVGDPYLPDGGGSGYDVQHYDVRLTVDSTSELTGETTVSALATQDLDAFHLDLELPASTAWVNGRPARVVQDQGDLRIEVGRTDASKPAIAVGSRFTVTVAYAGNPSVPELELARAYYRTGEEFMIVGEPEAAALWFPANDHPSDPATMDVTLRVPTGVEGIAAGRLTERGPDPLDGRYDRWRWSIDSPSVTYATFLGFGQYDIEEGIADGRPYLYAVSQQLSESQRLEAMAWLRKTPAAIAELEGLLGPYPFSGIGGYVPGTDFVWGGIEAAMRPVYSNRMVGAEYLLNHELAHMWQGDTVTLAQWNDMFINESLTSYAEWLTTTDVDPKRRFARAFDNAPAAFWGPPLSDPGVRGMFERVYDRGPMVVHALRTRMGDQAFFAFWKRWAQQRGPRSLEDFREQADTATSEDLAGFFTEWLDQTDRPAATVANGVQR